MKCIKNVETNEIKRIDDVVAQTRVVSGEWIYIPKSEWKLIRGKVSKTDTQNPINPQTTDTAIVKEKKKKKERVAEQKPKQTKQKEKKRGK